MELMAEASEQTEKAQKPLRPRQCHKYLQKRLAEQFPRIVEGFITEAVEGGCAHMKLAVELLETARDEGRKKKGSALRFLEELGD